MCLAIFVTVIAQVSMMLCIKHNSGCALNFEAYHNIYVKFYCGYFLQNHFVNFLSTQNASFYIDHTEWVLHNLYLGFILAV